MEKEREYQKLIENAVCRITIDEKSYVTAFAVNNKYLLSAGHSFVGLAKDFCCIAEFINGACYRVKVIHAVYDHEQLVDFAILEFLDVNFNITPLPVSFFPDFFGEFISIGSGEKLSGFSSLRGNIVGKYYNSNDKEYFLKASSGQAGQLGYSGSPIFSLNDKSVIAIQCEATLNDVGAERDTILAFPLSRLPSHFINAYLQNKPVVYTSTLIENYLLPLFGKSLLGLECSDNLDAYMRCIVVKLLYESNERFTVFVAKGLNDTIVNNIRKHHKTRKLKYGIIGGMLKANVPIIYDFVNDKCYQLDLGGTSRESNLLNKKNRGAREDRLALLVAPIRNVSCETVGVLSFDFFPVYESQKNIIDIISNSAECGRILYLSELYAQTLSQLLLNKYKTDIDFLNIHPK